MGEFAESIQGIKEACEFLDFPVVSGNVSFYNGTNKKNIFPTPVIGGVGLIPDVTNSLNHHFKKENSFILLIGKTFGHIEQSCFLRENFSIAEGLPPEVNLNNEKNNGETILKLIRKNLVLSAHDVSSGGLLVALSEMSIGSNLGAKILKPRKLRNKLEYFFGEDQGRYVIEINSSNLDQIIQILEDDKIYFENIGKTQKEFFEVEGELKLNINDLFKINNTWYNKY